MRSRRSPMVVPMTPVNRFRDRSEAGQALARHLTAHTSQGDALVLALPRGGVPVAQEVAQHLDLPLDVFVVRKLGLPGHTELAMGAIASGGIRLLDDLLIAEQRVSPADVATVTAHETAELKHRERLYRGNHPAPEIARRHIILIDDGVATGYTMRVAVLALRRLNPARLTVAIPVGAPETCVALAGVVDDLICPVQPNPFHAVGLWYDHFPPITDKQVRNSLAQAAEVVAAHHGHR